jgi:predicted Fe-Mo cluster-binding NifX family protein
MKVCFPVNKEEGINSKVYGHFGSAPVFILVDTENNSVTTIENKDQHHEHGACNPMKALDNQKVDAVVVGGIGGGALSKLNQLKIKVFHAQTPTVRENIAMLKTNNLPEFSMAQTCSGHSHIDGCSHGKLIKP